MTLLHPFLLPLTVGLVLLAMIGVTIQLAAAEDAPFDAAAFDAKTTSQENDLLNAGKLRTLGSLLGDLKANPVSGPITLPAPLTVRLESPDLYDKLLPATLVVGLYYHCADCQKMHFVGAGGFAMAKDGVVSTCAHVLDFDPKKMLQAYPAVIDYKGTVYPVDRIITLDPVADIVILHATGGDFPPLPMRAAPRVGEPVYCLSHPNNDPFVFTSGIVSRVETAIERGRPVRAVDVSCEYSPGSSGCPITDSAGNVVAQVNKISPQIIASEKVPGAQATVFNLRPATASVEIARLADPANRPVMTSEPVKAKDDEKVAGREQPSPTPGAVTAPFIVHSKYELFTAPVDTPVSQEIKNFDDLRKRIQASGGTFTGWFRGDKPNESTEPNYAPVGFDGVTGYYDIPGSTGPRSSENTIARKIAFRMTFHDRKESEVGLQVDVNDTRTSPEAADHLLKIDATLTRNAFTLVKLGPPLDKQQAWLAIVVDDFAAKAVMMSALDGKLPADKKVDFKFTAADGREIDTTKMRGKVILVDFWATWCGPCVEALPRIAELYHRYHDQGFEVLGINLDSERSVMDKFLKRQPHPWPQSVSAPSGQNPLADRFDFHGIPFFLLIDKTGTATIIEARNPDTESRIVSLLQAKE